MSAGLPRWQDVLGHAHPADADGHPEWYRLAEAAPPQPPPAPAPQPGDPAYTATTTFTVPPANWAKGGDWQGPLPELPPKWAGWPAPAAAPAPGAATPQALAAEFEKLAVAALERANERQAGGAVTEAGYWRGRHDASTALATEVRNELAPAWDGLAARLAEARAERDKAREVVRELCEAAWGPDGITLAQIREWAQRAGVDIPRWAQPPTDARAALEARP